MDSSSSQEQQHQNLQYHLSIQTKQQQMIDNKLLEQLSLPKLRTTSKILVRDNPQQIDSSFHRDHNNNNNTKLTVPTNPPFNTNETTTDQRQREPRRHQHSCAGDIEPRIPGTQPTQQIHSSSQQHQTHVPPSIPFPSDNLSSSNLTGLPKSLSPDTLRTQPCRWRFCVHRRRKRPTIARRGP